MTKIFRVCCILIFFCLGSFSSASSGKGEIDVKFKGQIVSAELQGVSLREILEKLMREKGIWCKGDEFVFEEKVSVGFTDLPLEEGLRRILSDINHVLVFDQDRRLEGLFILGKKSPGKPMARNRAIFTKNPFSSQLEEGPTVIRNPFEAFSDVPFQGNPRRKSMGTSTRKNFSPHKDLKTQMGNMTLMEIAPSSEDPFADPFGASLEP